MNKKIELAKSRFTLAQIFIILAGFLFAASGIAFANAQNTLNFGLSLAEEAGSKNCGELNNISNYQKLMRGSLDYVGESVVSNLNLWEMYSQIGIFFVVLSLLSWLWGYYGLKKIKKEK